MASLADALRYQEESSAAFGNPNLLAQGRNKGRAPVPGVPLAERWERTVSLDPQKNTDAFDTFVDVAGGFVPGVGQALAARDVERARRDDDKFGMGLAALGLIPFGGGVAKAAKVGAKKQAAIDAGLYHPIGGGKKLDVPVSEMTFRAVENTPMAPRAVINPESMQGSTLVPAIGDRTAAGRRLEAVGDIELPTPVQLEGGAEFMRTHAPYGSAWASDKGVITRLGEKVRQAGERGEVYMPHVAMGHTSGDFSTMMADALLEQMRGSKISNTAKKEFDVEMRRVRPEWKGIDDPRSMADLNTNGAVRTAFVNAANLDYFGRRGFPDVTRTRVAITDPNLMDVPSHSAGYTVAKMDPSGRSIVDPVAPHTTYSQQLGGQYVGGFERQIPRDVMFPDFYKSRRAQGIPEAGDRRSFDLSYPTQSANQEWLDGVMRYLEETRR